MRLVHPCRYMGKGLVLEEETVGFFRDFFFLVVKYSAWINNSSRVCNVV